MYVNSYNTCWNSRIVIKDGQKKSYQNHIEGKFILTQRTKPDFIKESVSVQRLQRCELLNIYSFYTPYWTSPICKTLLSAGDTEINGIHLDLNCSLVRGKGNPLIQQGEKELQKFSKKAKKWCGKWYRRRRPNSSSKGMSLERGTTWTEFRVLSSLWRWVWGRSFIHSGIKGSVMEKDKVCTFVVVEKNWRKRGRRCG